MAECPICHGEKVLVRADGDYVRAQICTCQLPCPICGGSGCLFETDELGYRKATTCVFMAGAESRFLQRCFDPDMHRPRTQIVSMS